MNFQLLTMHTETPALSRMKGGGGGVRRKISIFDTRDFCLRYCLAPSSSPEHEFLENIGGSWEIFGYPVFFRIRICQHQA